MPYTFPIMKDKCLAAKVTEEQLSELSSVTKLVIAGLEKGESCDSATAGKILNLHVDDIMAVPSFSHELDSVQLGRLEKVYNSFNEVLDSDFLTWVELFKYEPLEFVDSEIKVWEEMADIFNQFKETARLTLEEKVLAYNYLVANYL